MGSSAQFGTSRIGLAIKLFRPQECVNLKTEYFHQYLRLQIEFILWIEKNVLQLLVTIFYEIQFIEFFKGYFEIYIFKKIQDRTDN